MSKEKSDKEFKTSGIIRYSIELSIVIIGVLITLSISNIISNNSKQSEVKGVIGFIRMELKDNLDKLNRAEKKWEKEQMVFLILQQNFNNLKKIPADTLSKYRNVIGDRHSISNESDSYDVLKSSLLMQYIKDKDFLCKLAKAYGGLQLINNQMSRYSEMKGTGITHTLDNISDENIRRWTNGSIYDYFDIPLRDKSYRIFVYTGGSMVDKSLFDKCRQTIMSTMEDIDNNWGQP